MCRKKGQIDFEQKEGKEMKKVIVVRGIAGCGKSTYVEGLIEGVEPGENVRVCSADYFFMDKGEYKFDPTKIAHAHNFCMWKFLNALAWKNGLVIVDNTFVHKWEYENYICAAKLVGWEVEVHEFRVGTVAQIRECHRRCRHGVPLDVIARMAVEFEHDETALWTFKIKGVE